VSEVLLQVRNFRVARDSGGIRVRPGAGLVPPVPHEKGAHSNFLYDLAVRNRASVCRKVLVFLLWLSCSVRFTGGGAYGEVRVCHLAGWSWHR
jgi:hypothetical protein